MEEGTPQIRQKFFAKNIVRKGGRGYPPIQPKNVFFGS